MCHNILNRYFNLLVHSLALNLWKFRVIMHESKMQAIRNNSNLYQPTLQARAD